MSTGGLRGGTLLGFLVLAGIWGASFLFIKVALEGLSPLQIVYGRMLAGASVMAAVVLLGRHRLPRSPRMWLDLAFMSVVANIVPFFLFAFAEEHITSGLAGVLNGTTPLFTLAFAVAALPEERMSAARAAGFVVGFLGVVLVVGPWDQNPLTSSVVGQVACLGAAACYGVAFVYTRRYITPRGHAPEVLAGAQLGVGTLLLTAAFPLVAREPVVLTPLVAGSVLALGGLGTGIAYLLFYRLIHRTGATTASMVTYVIPVVAVVLGVAVLSEPVTWNLFAGAAVVILGVAIADGRFHAWRGPAGETIDAPMIPPDPRGNRT